MNNTIKINFLPLFDNLPIDSVQFSAERNINASRNDKLISCSEIVIQRNIDSYSWKIFRELWLPQTANMVINILDNETMDKIQITLKNAVINSYNFVSNRNESIETFSVVFDEILQELN